MSVSKLFLSIFLSAAAAAGNAIAAIPSADPTVSLRDNRVNITLGLDLDSLKLGANKQLFIVPVMEDSVGNRAVLPAILVNGRNMHYAWERGSIKRGGEHNYTIQQEVRRRNGKPQHIDYASSLPYETWMMAPTAALTLITDSCGCGHQYGRRVSNPTPLNLNPAPRMRASYLTPAVTELPVAIHEGRARVQFEVDRTELHDLPYTCRNGQRIDNRAQLKVIDDSVQYALSDPNVEIASIKIVGYASPESPYLHNEMLSTGRSRALAEYLAAKYNLPSGRSEYDAVAENWREFRELVEKSEEINATQRAQLLQLIDATAYGPADYDAKERTLKTDPRFASLYRSLILPKWFPMLRATEFAISTRLKPLSDEELAKVIMKSPEMMSLNQMMRVARLYEEGSSDFNRVIDIALSYYPEDATANLNAAVAALTAADYAAAEAHIAKSGNSAEAENVRGILATQKGDFESAIKHFQNALPLREAADNLQLIQSQEEDPAD